MQGVEISTLGRQLVLPQPGASLDLGSLVPGESAWEVEIGFGKGRYLLGRAERHPQVRFLGIELSAPYYRMACRRRERRAVRNLALIRGEALFVMSAILPAGFADRVHVYFPDPWPKARHQKRRLFDRETVDLVLGLLRSGGELFFATDHLDYGSVVRQLLESHPATEVTVWPGPWPDGARTNYEAKYEREHRSILRLRVVWNPADGLLALHPAGREGILAAVGPRSAEPGSGG